MRFIRKWFGLWLLLCASVCNRLEALFFRAHMKVMGIRPEPSTVVWLTPEQLSRLIQGENPFEGGEIPADKAN